MHAPAQTSQVRPARHEANEIPGGQRRELRLTMPWDREGQSIDIALDCGATYQITCHTNLQAQSILDDLQPCDGVAIVSQNGGLLAHLSVRDNLSLPSTYHGDKSSLADLERDAAELLSACGLAESPAEWMCASPSSLNQLDKRLVAYVRALLSRPEILVFDHLFEGLTRSEVDRVLDWRRVFQNYFPFRTLIYIDGDFHGLPHLQDCVTVTAKAEH